MYTIIMNDDKSLTTTVKTKLYQKEKLVDKIQFLFPLLYNDEELSEYIIRLEYTDQRNVIHSEILAIDKENYPYKENYFRCILPVDTNLTAYTGEIKIRLSLIRIDANLNTQFVLHTGEETIEIYPVRDLYSFVPDESLEFADRLVGALEAKIQAMELMNETYTKSKADNIKVDKDTSELYLTAEDEQIGDKISLKDLGDSIDEAKNG